MSLLATLSPADGSKHYRKRVGRGRGSGLGQTAGKGHKGQLARSGGKVRRGFEGGQTPLIRRLPKFGFSNVDFANEYEIVNLDQLNKFDSKVDLTVLQKAGIIKGDRFKVLGRGKLTKSITVVANYFSKSAADMIAKSGGKAEVVK